MAEISVRLREEYIVRPGKGKAGRPAFWLSGFLILVSMLACCPAAAYAVIPSLLGPLQGLLAILPQILLFIVAGFAALFSIKRWRTRFSRLTSARPRTKIMIGAAVFVLISGSVAALLIRAQWTTGRHSAASLASQELIADQSSLVTETWPTFRGGLTRTGNTDQQPGPQAGEEIWVFRDLDFRTGNFSSSPAVTGDRIYVGSAQADIFSSGGIVYCLDAGSGEMIWKFQTTREIFSSPAVVDGRVYIGEGLHQDVDSRLYCLDASTGSFLWSFQTSSHVESSPAVVDGRVFFGGGADGVYCINAETGEEIWHYPGIHVDISPAVHDGSVYVGTGYGDMSIYCLDADTGAQKWKRPMGYPIWGSPSLVNGRAYFGIGNGNFLESDEEPYGKVVCIDAITSEIIWCYEVADSVLTAIALTPGLTGGGFVYFGSRDGNLYCLHADSGKLKWKWATGRPVLSSPAIADESVYFGSDNGIIYCLDSSDGQLKWEFDTTITAPDGTKIFSSPAVANNRVYVGSSKFYFFCIGK
jgi:outer membrane protein assembly factor BamB